MKTFEISKKISKNGRRHFKVILHEIYPDSCVDEVNEVGTQYNENGISWIREYCERALPSIEGMSLRCEFLDEERTFLNGHGETDIKDGLPVFEDAVMVGTFEKGYIEEIETDDGEKKTVCIGEGTIDGLCYHNFTEKLEEDIEDGNAPFGSVEILRTEDNEGIVYKYGYKDIGRIPMEFIYSGYALLSVRPADPTAKILELNDSHKEEQTMSENEIKAIVSQVVAEMNSHADEISKIKAECEERIADCMNMKADSDKFTSELNERIEELTKKVEALEAANSALLAEKETMTSEMNALKSDLETAQKNEKIGELNKAIEGFSDEQKAYAKAEIDAFNENPLTSEINSVVDRIYAGIGRKSQEEEAKMASEIREDEGVEDIFSEVCSKADAEEDVDIF